MTASPAHSDPATATFMASASGDLGLRPSTVNLKSRSTGELTARDFQEYASPAFQPNGVVADGPQSVAGLSTITDTPSSAQGRIIRPPPFSRKLRKSLFIRPGMEAQREQRGPQ